VLANIAIDFFLDHTAPDWRFVVHDFATGDISPPKSIENDL